LNYSQLTPQQRTQFQISKQLGLAVVEIAEILGVHFSTLYREIQRNRQRDGEYDSFAAQEKALARRRIPRRVSARRKTAIGWINNWTRTFPQT
jgi:IS30 family transposase